MNLFIFSSEKNNCLFALLGSLLATVLICAVFSELFIRMCILPDDLFWKHVDLFFDTKSSNAAFGDSQMARGFTGASGFVNLAYPADSIPQMETEIKTFYAHRKPERVIVEAGVQMLSMAGLEEFPRDYHKIFAEGHRRYSPFGLYIMDGYYRSRIVEYIRIRLSGETDPDRKTVFTAFGGLMNDASMTAAMQPADWKAVQVIMQKRVSAHAPPDFFEKNEYAASYKNIIAWLSAQGASVCMVTMPVMPVYRETVAQMGYEDRFAKAISFFRDVAWVNNVKYVSYWDDIQDPTLFLNGDHLNSRGATIITPRIMQDCFDAVTG